MLGGGSVSSADVTAERPLLHTHNLQDVEQASPTDAIGWQLNQPRQMPIYIPASCMVRILTTKRLTRRLGGLSRLRSADLVPFPCSWNGGVADPIPMIGMCNPARAFLPYVAHGCLFLLRATNGLVDSRPLPERLSWCAMLVLLTPFADRQRLRTYTLDGCTMPHCARNV